MEFWSAADAADSSASNDAGTTMPDAPGVSVWPPITYAPAALAVKVWEPIVNKGRGGVGAGNRDTVLLPMTTRVAPGARLMGVPDTVIVGDPGVSVWPQITYAPAALAVNVWEPIVKGGRESGAVGKRVMVLLPMTARVAPGARLMGVPDTVIAGDPGMSVWPLMI